MRMKAQGLYLSTMEEPTVSTLKQPHRYEINCSDSLTAFVGYVFVKEMHVHEKASWLSTNNL